MSSHSSDACKLADPKVMWRSDDHVGVDTQVFGWRMLGQAKADELGIEGYRLVTCPLCGYRKWCSFRDA